MAYDIETKRKVFKEILRRISQEGYSLRKTLLDPDFPSSETFYKWLEEKKWEGEEVEQSKRYARACEERHDLMFEDILHIADDSSRDMRTVNIGTAENPMEVETLDKEHVQRSKIRIDARKWALAKMNPKKYGNKIDVTTDGQALNMTDEEKDARLAALLAKAKDLDGADE